jgi:DNA-binding response OmpR family regulator
LPESLTKSRVLVADDERAVADTLVRILSLKGFDARAAYTGEGAFKIAQDFAPEILISDVLLGEQNGIDLAIRIRSFLPQIRIILFTGQDETSEPIEKARAEGAEIELLIKPVHPQELLDVLRGRQARSDAPQNA